MQYLSSYNAKNEKIGEFLVKVCPHYAARHTAAKVAPCHKYMWTLRRLGCGMPFDAARPKNSIGKLLVPSKEAARHMMSKGFQNDISHFEKKIKPSSPILFHSFGNLKKVCKKFFCHVDAIALAAYAEQLLLRGKAAVCCILPHGIVWTYLKMSKVFLEILRNFPKYFTKSFKIYFKIFQNDFRNLSLYFSNIF